MRPLARPRAGLHEVVGPAALELPVERRKPLLGDLALLRPPHIPFRPRSELLGRQLLGAPAHAGRDVAPVNPQLPPVAVDAADDDVRVRVAGVEVVDRRPLHFAPEVPLERRHQAPHVDGEVELRTVLGRDNETKLVLLAGTRLLEDPRANRPLRVVQHALRAVLLDAVALDVANVQGGRLGGGRPHAQQVRLDDDAARAGLERVHACALRARRRVPPRRRAKIALRNVRPPSGDGRDGADTHARPKNRQFVVVARFLSRDFRCPIRSFPWRRHNHRFFVTDKWRIGLPTSKQLTHSLYLALRIHSGFAKSR